MRNGNHYRRPPRPSGFVVFWLLSVLVSAQPILGASGSDHGLWNDLLGKYVTDGVVDYRGFKAEEERLDRYLDGLAAADTKAMTRNQALAFYINAYNAWTVKLILSAYPGVRSIKELGSVFQSPWKKEIVRIDGNLVSLDHIEHAIIRKRFQEPRIHFAANCASKGCPPLLAEAYRGERLDSQLERVTTAFINDPTRTLLKGDTLYISKIFKWYVQDFDEGVVEFVLRHSVGALRKELSAVGPKAKLKVKYLDYDWTLNGQ
jgi:hypothetical protein